MKEFLTHPEEGDININIPKHQEIADRIMELQDRVKDAQRRLNNFKFEITKLHGKARSEKMLNIKSLEKDIESNNSEIKKLNNGTY